MNPSLACLRLPSNQRMLGTAEGSHRLLQDSILTPYWSGPATVTQQAEAAAGRQLQQASDPTPETMLDIIKEIPPGLPGERSVLLRFGFACSGGKGVCVPAAPPCMQADDDVRCWVRVGPVRSDISQRVPRRARLPVLQREHVRRPGVPHRVRQRLPRGACHAAASTLSSTPPCVCLRTLPPRQALRSELLAAGAPD